MKRLNKLIVFGLLMLSSWSCKKDIIDVNINPSAVLVATASTQTAVLLKDNALKDALSVSWNSPDYGFQAAPGYTVYIDKKGNNFSKQTVFSVGSDLKKVFNTAALNNLLIGMNVLPGTAQDMEIKVEALLGVATKLTSSIVTVKVTPYLDKLDLSTTWGIVGSATPNGWNGPDLPVYKTSVNNELVAYVNLIVGDIKMRTNNDWAVNLGGVGGVLSAGGANIAIAKAGMYKVSFNPVALTYKVELFTWGIVGDATAGGWNGPDLPMWYDSSVDLWRAEVKLTAANIKFRLNNDWGTNFGGTAGNLENAGANIAIAAAGSYLVTADFVKLKYTVTPYKPWGLVGSFPASNWGGVDTKFTYDLSTKKWVLNNVVLPASQIKFRENDDWANNFGAATGADGDPIGLSGALLAGGKNFGVTAATWSFELDLSNAASPTYKATKK